MGHGDFWAKLRSMRKTRAIKWGMVIDLDKCIGCLACVQACRAENNIAHAGEDEMDLGRGIFWMEMLPVPRGETTEASVKMQPLPCFQCENTPCIKYCPTHATATNAEGITGMVYDRCIGCRYCTVACPYTRRYFNWYKPNLPEEMKPLLNPDVSTRYRGVVEKCNFCYHRIREAKWNARIENRSVRDGDVKTACQTTCPTSAIEFGNLQDHTSKVYRLARLKRAKVSMENLGTEPKVFFLEEEDAHVR